MASTMNRFRFRFLMFTAPISLIVACSVQEGHPVEMDAGAVGTSVGGSGTKATGTSSAGGSTITGGSGAIAGGSFAGGSTLTVGGSQAIGGSASVGGTGINNGGGSSAGNSSVTTGGTQAVGATSGTGGSNPTGSTTAVGGAGGISATVTGGVTSAGGVSNAGGSAAAGGTSGIVTTGGIASTGGTVGAGGVAVTGGVPSAGGMTSTGGAVATGGMIATGGTMASSNTGGVVGTGGVATGGAATGGATSCTINSVIYPNGYANTSNACQACQSSVSATGWSPLAEGASCGTIGGTVCHANACVAGCYIGSAYYAPNAANAADACQTCQPSTSTKDWSMSLSEGGTCVCTGSLESIQSTTGLCVAKMVSITAPSPSNNYSIDATEVTRGQYDLWLATKPALPAATDANCGYVTSYAEQAGSDIYTGTDASHHPVVYVDWCDAHAYCKGVGKRLCGAIGGGATPEGSAYATDVSQWYRVCSSGGVNTYPYGNTYQATYCAGNDYGTSQTVAVGSINTCVTTTAGYAGAYDLSGNVFEWEDGCVFGTGTVPCYIRGGAFNVARAQAPGAYLDCGTAFLSNRNTATNNIGFRCCSP